MEQGIHTVMVNLPEIKEITTKVGDIDINIHLQQGWKILIMSHYPNKISSSLQVQATLYR